MYVLGHHHVTDQQKSESRASLVQYLHKTVPRARCSKKPPASITTEGDDSTRMIYSLGVLEAQDIVKKSLRHPPSPRIRALWSPVSALPLKRVDLRNRSSGLGGQYI